MKRLAIISLAIGLTDIAAAHTLDSSHSTAEALWHQVSAGHHMFFTLGVIASGVALYLIGRWIENRRS
jgi:hypothetical protein